MRKGLRLPSEPRHTREKGNPDQGRMPFSLAEKGDKWAGQQGYTVSLKGLDKELFRGETRLSEKKKDE